MRAINVMPETPGKMPKISPTMTAKNIVSMIIG